MKKFVLLFVVLSQPLMAQTVTFLEKNDTLQKPKYQEFLFLNENTNLSFSTKVATVQSSGSLKSVAALYEKIKSESQKLGANSFRFLSFKKVSADAGELILTVYFTPENILGMNFENNPKNKVFIFGNENLADPKTQSFKADGEKFEIASGQFRTFTPRIGEELKISKGGFTGMTLWIKGQEDKQATFLNFSGIGLAGAQYNPMPQSVGVNINTGKIHRMEPNLALLLLNIYTEQQ